MAKKLYVGNLAYSVTQDQLAEAFGQHGNVVEAKIIIDRYSNRSKGFGFVEMETEDEAQAALSGLNGSEFEGRELRIDLARERAPRERY
jgi:RNA recognition motif-containing protein